MPMPNALRGVLSTCVAELVEGDPEDTFFSLRERYLERG